MAKIDELKKQLVSLQKKIDVEEKRIKEKEAKERKRKIEIIGAYYLDKAIDNGSLSQLVQELDSAGMLKKKADRILFGLSANTKAATADKASQIS